MKRWPTCMLFAATAACAYPVTRGETSADPNQEIYRALGQEPGWALLIDNGRIDYTGDYGETNINVARPDPRTTFNGHRYETQRLIVDVTHSRCHDGMSGHAYADTVIVTADGKAVRGCGGERQPQFDS